MQAGNRGLPRLGEADERRAAAPALGRSVGEGRDERVLREERLDDGTLDADAAAVDQPHFAEAARLRRLQVLVDDRRYVARLERVEIEGVLDRQLDGLVVYSCGPAITCCCQCL